MRKQRYIVFTIYDIKNRIFATKQNKQNHKGKGKKLSKFQEKSYLNLTKRQLPMSKLHHLRRNMTVSKFLSDQYEKDPSRNILADEHYLNDGDDDEDDNDNNSQNKRKSPRGKSPKKSQRRKARLT